MEHEPIDGAVPGTAVRRADMGVQGNDDDEDIGGVGAFAFIAAHLRMQDVLIEQMGREMDLMAEVVMTMSARIDGMEEDGALRAQEAECRFEAAFTEIESLRAAHERAAYGRAGRRARLRRLGGLPPL